MAAPLIAWTNWADSSNTTCPTLNKGSSPLTKVCTFDWNTHDSNFFSCAFPNDSNHFWMETWLQSQLRARLYEKQVSGVNSRILECSDLWPDELRAHEEEWGLSRSEINWGASPCRALKVKTAILKVTHRCPLKGLCTVWSWSQADEFGDET